VWVAADGAAREQLFAVNDIKAFGKRAVTRHGAFIDYDASVQPAPDLLTHGMAVGANRWFIDVYPDVTGPALGGARS
jgi:hypothetical protein